MAQDEIKYERNQFGIVYKQNNEMVEALDVCEHWQMMEGLQNAGRKSGVVKDMVTKEVIIR